MEQGWIYILVNSSIPGLVKVGRTTRLPADRVAELSGATGVATPFVLAFEQEFADCSQAEHDIHAELDRRGCRVAANREFFRGSPSEVVRLVLQVATEAGVGPKVALRPSPEDLLEEGDRHLFGTGETLQDLEEALRCYRLAAARGSLIALERLGAINARSRGKGSASRRRALRYLRDGVRRGNYYCYCEMATLFAEEAHIPNFNKAWDLFFRQRGLHPCAEVEAEPGRYVLALRRYIAASLDLGVTPGHQPDLVAHGELIVQAVLAALDGVRDVPESCRRLTTVLRWAYETLLPRPVVPFQVPGVGRRWFSAFRPSIPA